MCPSVLFSVVKVVPRYLWWHQTQATHRGWINCHPCSEASWLSYQQQKYLVCNIQTSQLWFICQKFRGFHFWYLGQYSPVARYAFLALASFEVRMMFYCWFLSLDISETKISRVPLWHPRGKSFTGQKQNGHQPNLWNSVTLLSLVIETQSWGLNQCVWGQESQSWSKIYWYPIILPKNLVIWCVFVSIGVKHLWKP